MAGYQTPPKPHSHSFPDRDRQRKRVEKSSWIKIISGRMCTTGKTDMTWAKLIYCQFSNKKKKVGYRETRTKLTTPFPQTPHSSQAQLHSLFLTLISPPCQKWRRGMGNEGWGHFIMLFLCHSFLHTLFLLFLSSNIGPFERSIVLQE